MEKSNSANKQIKLTPVVDFLSWFQNEYLKRRQKNYNYSIRSFSNYIGISPATVSHLLSGKRKPSTKFATRLFTKLDITPEERNIVLSSLKKLTLQPTNTPNSEYHFVALDAFKFMSEWFHYAILELISVRDFTLDYKWIAQQLSISVPEARHAIDRLLRLDLVEEKNGKLIKTHSLVTNGDDALTSSAHKQLQRHVLQKALDAIDTVSIEEKDISSMTMAIDERKIPHAKKLITKFRRDLCNFLEDGPQTRVYNLGIQLYPISKKLKNRES